MMDADTLYEMLRKVQEPKGYFFNPDRELVFDLLRSLLVNKERYGYMSCPCRLASGDKEHDRDIMCPCVYTHPRRGPVRKLLLCALRLEGVDRRGDPHEYVPERRPADKNRW